MTSPGQRLHRFWHERPRASAACALVSFSLAVIVVFVATRYGGTTALSNPAAASEYRPPLRLFLLLFLLLVGLWFMGVRPHIGQLFGLIALGLTISWALRPYEDDPHNEILAAMREEGVYYAQIGDIFGIAALLVGGSGIAASICVILWPDRAPDVLRRIGKELRTALRGGVALPVVASAFVLAVFGGDAWDAMSTTPAANIFGLAIVSLMSATWLLNRNTPQPWWMLALVIIALFAGLVFVFLLTTSLLVQPEMSLEWINEPLPGGIATVESARIKLAVMFSAIAVLAVVNAERPELKGAG